MGQERPPRRLRGLSRVYVLGRSVPVARGARSRLLGLALLRLERAGEGLLIPRCRSVHTFGMRFPLDLVFLGPDGRVLLMRRAVQPGRLLVCRGAAAVLELPAPPQSANSASRFSRKAEIASGRATP